MVAYAIAGMGKDAGEGGGLSPRARAEGPSRAAGFVAYPIASSNWTGVQPANSIKFVRFRLIGKLNRTLCFFSQTEPDMHR